MLYPLFYVRTFEKEEIEYILYIILLFILSVLHQNNKTVEKRNFGKKCSFCLCINNSVIVFLKIKNCKSIVCLDCQKSQNLPCEGKSILISLLSNIFELFLPNLDPTE